MIAAMPRPPLAIALVLGLLTLLIVACLLATIIVKVLRDRRQAGDIRLREQLADLPAAVALDSSPPAAPLERNARRVARDMVIAATFPIDGLARQRAITWFEVNGYVDETIAQMRQGRWYGTRPSCALRLGRMGSPTAAPLLAQGLNDRDYRIRDACATALGRVGSAEHVKDLIDSLSRRDVPKGVLSNALLQLGDDADDALIACLDHEDDAARELVVQVIGLRRCRKAVPTVMRLLEDPAPVVRREAILALATIAGEHTIQVDPAPLLRLANDTQSIVRSAAATGLGTILGDRAAPVLTQMCRDSDYWVSHRAAESLCRLPSGEHFGWQVLATHDPSPLGRQARAACLEWMERTGGIERRFERLLTEADDAELIVSLAVLEEVGSRAWGDLFAQVPANAGIPEVAA